MEPTAPAAQRGEYRLAVSPLRDVAVRDASGTGDGSWTLEGYAAVYEQETTLFEIPGWIRMREEIARGAFENVLSLVAAGTELVHLNFGHDMNSSVAASDVDGVGGLELADDFHGLRFFARVDPDDLDVQRLVPKMARRIVRQSSFAFTIAEEELVSSEVLEDETLDQLWRITEIGHLYDVCVCPQGAYPQTESHLRSLAAASLGRAGIDPAGLDRRSSPAAAAGEEGEQHVAPAEEPAGEPDPARARELAQLRAYAATRTRQARRKDST